MNRSRFSFFACIVLFNALLALVGFFKINAIFGTKFAFFSFSNVIGPMIGLYAGLPCAFLVYLLRFSCKGILFGPSLFNPLSWYIPTFFASAYWSRESFIFRFLVPLLCIILFNLHSVGSQAFFYSFYWLIPLGLYFAPQKNVFVQALASTFIAHAVGSVLWLYWLPMTSEMFAALMPVVIVERFVFASGMVLVYYLVERARPLFSFQMGSKIKTIMQ